MSTLSETTKLFLTECIGCITACSKGPDVTFTVHTNTAALSNQKALKNSRSNMTNSTDRLSSGRKINSAKDDASGLQISNRLGVQTQGLTTAIRNANDGISISQTAEGGLSEVTSALERMRELSLQASNGSHSSLDRAALNKEFNQLKASIDSIAETTSFGGTRLLNGDFKEVSFQIGAASGQAVSMSLDTVSTNAKPMGGRLLVSKNIISHLSDGVSGPLSMSFAADKSKQHAINLSLSSSDNLEQIATQINGQSDLLSASVTHNGELQIFVPTSVIKQIGEPSFNGSGAQALGLDHSDTTEITVDRLNLLKVGNAQLAISTIDEALKYVDSQRAELGALQNRFEHAINNASHAQVHIADSRSRIADTDYAKEATDLHREHIRQQSGSVVLAKAQRAPISALNLLK